MKLGFLWIVAAIVLIVSSTTGCGGGGGSSSSSSGGGDGGSWGGPTEGVYGRLKSVTETGLVGAKILFYTESGTYLGSTIVGTGGYFSTTSIPLTAARFTINVDEIDPVSDTGRSIYFRQFTSDSRDYLMGEMSCLAPLPAFSGTKSFVGTLFVPARAGGTIPPPPTGCVG